MKLYLDANIIIYAYEAAADLRSIVLSRVGECCLAPGGSLVTSMFSRIECRVVPLRNGNTALLADYDDFFRGDGVELVEVTSTIIDLATALRAQYGLKSPDAIHLASAIHSEASLFLTADASLVRCSRIAVEVIRPPRNGSNLT